MSDEGREAPELREIFERAGNLDRPRRPFAVTSGASEPTYGSYARSICRARARIGHFFDADLFADPVFDILLDLYASEEEGVGVSVSSCVAASRVPQTTALRYIGALERRGLIQRHADPADRRRVWLRLSSDAKGKMLRYLEEISSIPLRR